MSDDDIIAQQEAIKAEIRATHAIVGRRTPLREALTPRWADKPDALPKLAALEERGYSRVRCVRPDGNCFYRALAVGIWEALGSLDDAARDAELERLLSVMSTTAGTLAGMYPPMVFEDYHDAFVEQLRGVPAVEQEHAASIHEDGDTADSVIMWLRFATAARLRDQADLFAAFLPDGVTLERFCNDEVLGMGREAEEIHLVALAGLLGVALHVAYLDNSSAPLVIHKFGDEASRLAVHLLYQPGHYDVLYRAS